jgi:ribosomal protein S18 acetylase RimI-like enzyme
MKNFCLSWTALLAAMLSLGRPSHAFSVSFGLGALLFQPKGLVTKPASGDAQVLLAASDFFVEAFWANKFGGGAEQLDYRTRRSLETSQFAEFRGRYAGRGRGQSELITCTLANGEVVACAGVEVTPIPEGNLNGPPSGFQAPLMSNLAVSREYRRKGIGERLVKEVERVARFEWGCDDCFLYVEQRNRAAVKLYEKLGYRKIWTDAAAKTLLPTANGNLKKYPTTIGESTTVFQIPYEMLVSKTHTFSFLVFFFLF